MGLSVRPFLVVIIILQFAGWTLSLPENEHPITNVSAPFGNDVTLFCNTQNNEGHWVKWNKMDTGHILAIETHIMIDNPRLSVRIVDNNTWALNIKTVQKEDHGLYKCESPLTTQTVFLEVLNVPVPPTIISSSNNTTIREMLSATLICNATGNPKPNITWSRVDGKHIDMLVNGTTSSGLPKWMTLSKKYFDGDILELPHISRKDSGSYQCTANNSISPAATQIIDLHVAYAPDRVSVTGPREARMGDKVTFTCFVQNSYPAAKVSWMVESKPHPAVSTSTQKRIQGGYNSKSTLSVWIPRSGEREIMFTCLASNSFLGVMEVDTYILPILEPDPKTHSRTVLINRITPTKGHRYKTKYYNGDINPKRGREKVAPPSVGSSTSNLKRGKPSPMRHAYFNMLTFLRFFGLLMAFH